MQRRTHLLRLIISLFVLAAFLVSCAPPTQEAVVVDSTATAAPTQAVVSASTATQALTLPPPAKYKESPLFAEQVTAGSLPPVEERLPENPKVLQPAESIGLYGGVLRRMVKPSADGAMFTRTVSYESLVTWTQDWTGIQPDIAEAFEVSDDAKTFTFHLRKGMKWSDGEPYTSADIKFFWEDVILNDDLTPAKPNWIKSAGELAEMEFPDDYTVIFKFANPNGLFLSRLATPDPLAMFNTPKHWAKQFHTTYADQADIDKMITEGQFQQWRDLWAAKSTWDPQVAGRPAIFAFYLVDAYVGGATQVTYERNPYYWKVDTEGQQLPYMDKLVYTIIDSVDAMVPKALNGEVDMQDRHIATDPNKPMFIDNMEKGDYRMYKVFAGSLNRMSIMFNLNHPDKVKNEIFNNLDFRIGLSYAINRQEIIDTVYVGVGEPWQTAPLPNSSFYDEEMAKQYTEYNLDLANEALDKAGYMKNASGKRLGPDGNPISFVVEAIDTNPQWSDMLNMISKYWAEVGINMLPKVLERSIFYANKLAYLHDAGVWSHTGFLADVLLDPRYFIPYSTESIWANGWADWYNGAPAGKDFEPPAVVKESLDLYDSINTTADVEEQVRLGKEMLKIAKENLWSIGIASAPDGYGIVKNNMHNVIDHAGGWLYPNPAPTNPETWYYDPPQK